MLPHFPPGDKGHKVLPLRNNGCRQDNFYKSPCEELAQRRWPVTFAINEYRIGRGIGHHFDFYRINKLEEAFDFGYEDYFYSGSLLH